MQPEFVAFKKIPRLARVCTVTEKIDGTNGIIFVSENKELYAGSRSRWVLTPDGLATADNFGFGKWVLEHKDELIEGLGIGHHYGEWWGQGIQRGYGLKEKRFSLFNTSIWTDDVVRPKCCHVVPVMFEGVFDTIKVEECVNRLQIEGSIVAPGFMNPEGVVIYHSAAGQYFKKTVLGDEKPKGQIEA